VLALDLAGGQITSVSSIVNPDKLTHLGQSPTSDRYCGLRSERGTGAAGHRARASCRRLELDCVHPECAVHDEHESPRGCGVD
jgi:hypothetical protein